MAEAGRSQDFDSVDAVRERERADVQVHEGTQVAPLPPDGSAQEAIAEGQTPGDAITLAKLRIGLEVLLPNLGMSATLGETRRALADQLALPANALDDWADDIRELIRQMLHEPPYRSSCRGSRPCF